MKIKLYQINLDRDTDRVAFDSLTYVQSHGGIKRSLYDLTFDGEITGDGIERTFEVFNAEIPDGYTGRSMSVSDVVEVIESDEVEPGFYYCDTIGFGKIEFLNENEISTGRI